MIQEIERLKSLGLGKQTVARPVGISRNAVNQYWEPPGAAAPSEPGESAAKPKYESPWAKSVDWEAVKQAVDAGEALAIWLEDRQRGGGAGGPVRGVAYTSFWCEFKRRYAEAPLAFHKTHPPGERIEFDYQGERPGFGYCE